MRALGNLIWHFPFFGFVSAFLHLLVGLLFMATVVGAPIGLGMLQYAKFLLRPFSSAMIEDPQKSTNPVWQSFAFVVWMIYLPFGIFLCLFSIVQILGMMTSVIGAPTALVLAKSLSTYLKPIHKICVPIDVRNEMSRQKARNYMDQKFNK